jgi:aminopeptidase
MNGESGDTRRGVLAARDALAVLLHVTKGASVVIVTDEARANIGGMFAAGARELGAQASTFVLPESARPLTAIPEDFLVGHPRADVYVNAFTGIAAETPFRIQLIGHETSTGARVGHAPGITLDMLLGGPMQVDYHAMARQAYALIDAFEGAVAAHITAPAGTDFTLDLAGRAFETDVDIEPGTMGNLPPGEIWCAPVETGMNGVMVVDGSIGDLGNVTAPLTIAVRAGQVESMRCADQALVAKLEQLMRVDDEARVVGELGIGLNPGARLTGNLLEDEKAGGTAHIAFGRNTDMPGGRNGSRTHRDFLFRHPTIEVTYADGRTATPVRDGAAPGR